MIHLTLPAIVERITEDVRRPLYEVRPLFFDGYEKRAEREDRAVERCTALLRKDAIDLVKHHQHEKLAAWSFYPSLSRHHLRLQIRLRKRTFDVKIFLVAFAEFDRRVVFCPKMSDLCFDVKRGETMENRAEEVITEYFRKQEKDEGTTPDDIATPGSARLTEITLELHAQQQMVKESDHHFAGMGSSETMDGTAELERTGRCLDRLYPNRLSSAILREEEITRLLALFARPKTERRPIVLVGGSQVGKTAIIHEFVRRRIEDADKKHKYQEGKVWLLGRSDCSPA